MNDQRIDAHHHLWELDRFDYDWLDDRAVAPIRRNRTVADYERAVADAGIAGAVVVEAQGSDDETRWLLATAASRPIPTRIVGGVDLAAPDLRRSLEALRVGPHGALLVGVRHQMQSEPIEWFARTDVREGLRSVAELGLVVDVVVTPDQLVACSSLVGDAPAVRFVLDHLGKPPIADGDLRRWHADLAAIARHDNVVAKISGLVTEAHWDQWTVDELVEVVERALTSFGPHRLMWGSDWPVCELAGGLHAWREAADEVLSALSKTERRLVLLDTAAATYRVPNLHPHTTGPQPTKDTA